MSTESVEEYRKLLDEFNEMEGQQDDLFVEYEALMSTVKSATTDLQALRQLRAVLPQGDGPVLVFSSIENVTAMVAPVLDRLSVVSAELALLKRKMFDSVASQDALFKTLSDDELRDI